MLFPFKHAKKIAAWALVFRDAVTIQREIMKRAGFVVAGFISLAAMSASASPISWMDWTSGVNNSVVNDTARGTMTIGSQVGDVLYTGEINFLQASGGTNYWIAPTGVSPYTNSAVANAPASWSAVKPMAPSNPPEPSPPSAG